MESETPPPPPTAAEVRTLALNPRPLPAPFAYVDPEHAAPASYLSVHSANSGRLHNGLIRRLSLHMQASFAHTVLGAPFSNELRMYDAHKLTEAVTHRPPLQPLITLSNHQSTLDDPVLLARLLPYSLHTDPDRARWGWCARELCFPTPFTGWFFRHGKIFPIVRGLGQHQPGVREAAEHVAAGQWMHVFPEGKCVPLARGIGPLRWGAGKLAADAWRRAERCKREKEAWDQAAAAANTAATSTAAVAASSSADSAATAAAGGIASPSAAAVSSAPAHAHAHSPCPLPPLLVPIVHHGMPRVMPFYEGVPRRGNRVRAIVGDPIEIADLVRAHEANAHNTLAWDYPREEDLWVAITRRFARSLQDLDQRLVDIEASEGDPTPHVEPHRAWWG